jgi:double-strand break repair protein MRE11
LLKQSLHVLFSSFLPSFVLQHECQIDFVESIVGTFRITQPGSSVATSLVQGEAVRKKVGILDINGKNFRLHPVPLTQVRSFITTDLCLREHRAKLDPDDNHIEDKVTKVLEEEVNVMIINAREKIGEVHQEAQDAGSNAGDATESPLKYKILNPDRVLVRLRVEHSGFSSMNNQRFGAKFVSEIANSDNILLFHRKKAVREATTAETKAAKKARAAMSKPIEPEELEQVRFLVCLLKAAVDPFPQMSLTAIYLSPSLSLSFFHRPMSKIS